MDATWIPMLSAVVGGALAIAGGYVAVVVGDRRRRRADAAERLRGIHRAVLSDTRDYMLSMLEVSMARAIADKASEEASGWNSAARGRRVDERYICDAQLLADYLQITNRLMALDVHRISGARIVSADPFGPDDARVFEDVRRRVKRAFVELERRLEADKFPEILDDERVEAIRASSPLSDHLRLSR